MKWFLSVERLGPSPFVWPDDPCYTSIREDRLEILKWLIQEGCPCPHAITDAVCLGKLDILKWLLQQDSPRIIFSLIMMARSFKRLDVLEWLEKYGHLYQQPSATRWAR